MTKGLVQIFKKKNKKNNPTLKFRVGLWDHVGVSGLSVRRVF